MVVDEFVASKRPLSPDSKKSKKKPKNKTRLALRAFAAWVGEDATTAWLELVELRQWPQAINVTSQPRD